MSSSVVNKRADKSEEKPGEETRIHTRILRFQLGQEESRAYWKQVGAQVSNSDHEQRDYLQAFGERWFGSVSENRAKIIMREMRARFDAFPAALDVLAAWCDMTPATRALICHWHLQLSDPLYRDFTNEFFEERREHFGPLVDRDQVIRWVESQQPDRWGRSTLVAFASKLLSAAYAAGLVETNRDPRPLVYPRVSDRALSYMIHLLREVRFEGTLLENPYLRSVGMSGKFLEDRLRTLPGAELRRMGDLVEFNTNSPNLSAWSDQNLGSNRNVDSSEAI